MQEHPGDVSHVEVIPLERVFENHYRLITYRPEDEVVAQQVGAHPGRHAEYRRQAQAQAVGPFPRGHFRPHLGHTYKVGGLRGVSSCTASGFLGDALNAIRCRYENPLIWTSHLAPFLLIL